MTTLDSPIPRFHLAMPVASVIGPYVLFEGETGERWTMFLLDPNGNALEFKAFADDSRVVAA